MRNEPRRTRSRAFWAMVVAAALPLLPAPLAAQHGRSAQATAVVRVEVLPAYAILPDSVTARRLAVAVPVLPPQSHAERAATVLPDRRRGLQIAYVGN